VIGCVLCQGVFRNDIIGRVCAQWEEGGEASAGGCVGGAGATRDDGEDVSLSVILVVAESVGQRGVFVADKLCGVR
jgi:hypothetical protein